MQNHLIEISVFPDGLIMLGELIHDPCDFQEIRPFAENMEYLHNMTWAFSTGRRLISVVNNIAAFGDEYVQMDDPAAPEQ
ncbi:MAG TPA: hypothetical protein PLD39_09680 [Flexilinea sp.]|nr:hypothetical protein [Flexilinea sp.]